MRQKEFKEMCIRIGAVDAETLKIDYRAVATLMWLGKNAVMKNIPERLEYARLSYQEDMDIINEYLELGKELG